MQGVLIPVNADPRPIDIQSDENGSTLKALQQLVGGYIEPFDVIFGETITLYVNEEGAYTQPPNRLVIANRRMAETGYLSQFDYTRPVREGEPYTLLHGPIVALGYDPETGETRDLTAEQREEVTDYFTRVSKPGSGAESIPRFD